MTLNNTLNTCPYCQKTVSLRGMPNHIKFKHPNEPPKAAVLPTAAEQDPEQPPEQMPELDDLPEQLEPQTGETEMTELENAAGEAIKIIKENPSTVAAGTAAAVAAPSVFEMAAEKFVQLPEAGQLVGAAAGFMEALTAKLVGKNSNETPNQQNGLYDGFEDF